QSAEGEHNPEKQAHGHQQAQILQRPEPDELEHNALRILVERGALEHARDLIRQQDEQQHARDHEPGERDFAQNVAPEDLPQPMACHCTPRPPVTRNAGAVRRTGSLSYTYLPLPLVAAPTAWLQSTPK